MNPTDTTQPTDPTPPATPPPLPPKVSTLDKILSDVQVAAQTVETMGVLIPGFGTAAAGGAAIADKLLQIILAGIRAHEAITGQPLDLDKLRGETLIP